MISDVLILDWLSKSWERSLASGLDISKKPEEQRLELSELKEKQELHNKLISIVTACALPLFNQVMGRTKNKLILSDKYGYVLKQWGYETSNDKLLNGALSNGVNWAEEFMGSNGIGTAIASKHPVSIIGEQHFLKQNKFMSCSASPILNAKGDLIAALDISSEEFDKKSHATLLFVSNLAKKVEFELLLNLSNAHYQLNLALDSKIINSGFQGIIIADNSGQILGVNNTAKEIICELEIGDPISTHFGKNWEKTATISKHNDLYIHTKRLNVIKDKNYYTNDQFSRLLKLEHLNVRANKILDAKLPLLITGEVGVGMEEFVQQIHSEGVRSESPLIMINCTTLPADSIETELFGLHNENSGKIFQANGGIIFLNEIDKVSLQTQGRLLRLLINEEIVSVSNYIGLKVDVQVVVGTHVNLAKLVKEGLFREDLYYKLNSFQLTLPPLRECGELKALINFIHKKYKKSDQKISDDLMSRMERYEWPGNLPEINNTIRIASIMAGENTEITLADLPDEIMKKLLLKDESSLKNEKLIMSEVDHKITPLKSRIAQDIMSVYKNCNGNISKAARELNISRNTLYRRLKDIDKNI